jgi:hypothetical protein
MVFREMVMPRENGKPIFPIKLKPCDLPGLLSDLQSINLTVDKESAYRRPAAGLKQPGLACHFFDTRIMESIV